ncbi:MAG: AAA domain-containing protein [Thermodesulfobacteriota bacterium]
MTDEEKSLSLLRFLKDVVSIRRQRLPRYTDNDKLIWFTKLPRERQECRSPLLFWESEETPDFWLEVKKTRPPLRASLPGELTDWIDSKELEDVNKEPEIPSSITVFVEQNVPDPEAPPGQQRIITEKVPVQHHLEDYPKLQEAWLNYLVNEWEPWAEKKRRWQEVQTIYEDVDFMRRRLEESEERFELFLGLGLLVWKDSTEKLVRRHLLTGLAEIDFDAARGILRVVPAATFETFRIEMDMLELQDRPRIDEQQIQKKLEDLDINAWDTCKVGEILREIANRAKGDSQVDEDSFEIPRPGDNTLRVSFAPAFVLRERRFTAPEEVIGRLLDRISDSPNETTKPWDQFLAEGVSNDQEVNNVFGENTITYPQSVERIFFPRPTNEEQRQIIHRLQASSSVVVKGPPGTGKSNTIANLISHLLATGERVLVTAQAPKALDVLRNMVPRGLQNLCLTALSSSREDQRLLEEGVRGIVGRKNDWETEKENWPHEITERDLRLNHLEKELANTERQLREYREAETFPHILPGGYEGTAAQIARQLEQERETLGWFPEVVQSQNNFPLSEDELLLLAEMHRKLTPENEQELDLETGDFDLLSPSDFSHVLTGLEEAIEKADTASQSADPDKLEILKDSATETINKTAITLKTIEENWLRSTRALGEMAHSVYEDLLVTHRSHWNLLYQHTKTILEQIEVNQERLAGAEVHIPPELSLPQLLSDTERRLDHLVKGGRIGIWFFQPKIIRETNYLEEQCRVNGCRPQEQEHLERIIACLRLQANIQEFQAQWPQPIDIMNGDNIRAAMAARELVTELEHILSLFDDFGNDVVPCIPVSFRATLGSQAQRLIWLKAIEAELARRDLETHQEPLSDCHQQIQSCLNSGRAHPSLSRLAEAIYAHDRAAWHGAWEQREIVKENRLRLKKYRELISRLRPLSPGLPELLQTHQGDQEWTPRLLALEKAWHWALACNWIAATSDPHRYEELMLHSHRLQEKIESQTEETAILRAWNTFFSRLDSRTTQNLGAWTKAIARIGKGTGKYAYRRRREARKYLMECIPKMPAWVMPLHKLWETVEAVPGLFDTIIIDEASQAGIESLVLLLLGKRIIVVGDDKQNSPEAVGVLEDDIARLVREHLEEFHFRYEYRPDTSLFDHAERAFGNLISLREHFRCVPEIIRFSNDLCYREAPLIPLRQAPPERLSPLRHTFVPNGTCQGDGQRIRNLPEAEELVLTIKQCLEDEAYEGKSMGVIVLQGKAQGELIERILALELDPQVIAERRLRCGVPATFQGDQRDVIFLSMVIAPDKHITAQTTLPAQRRYNVAMSRARDQVWLFHSMQPHDLSKDCLRRRLLFFFLRPSILSLETEELERLEKEALRTPRRIGSQPTPYESWFEVDVALELLRRNYRVHPQYEVAGKRIDLVIEGTESRLAVECDGDAWHGPEEYDRDMARQRQLERAGWTFFRVRESEFYIDRNRTTQDITRVCNELGIIPERQESELETDMAVSGQEIETDAEAFQASEPIENNGQPSLDFPESEEGPFTGYSGLNFSDPREASPVDLRETLMRIISQDGPLSRESIYRLYAEGCPHLHRITKTIREKINRTLGAMLRTGEIVHEDELGKGRPQGMIVRRTGTPLVRLRPAGRRDLEEIPPSEILLLLERLKIDASTRDFFGEDLIFRKILDHYGFQKLTRSRRKHLQAVLFSSRQKNLFQPLVSDRTVMDKEEISKLHQDRHLRYGSNFFEEHQARDGIEDSENAKGWNESSFFQDMRTKGFEAVLDVAFNMLEWIKSKKVDLEYGKGAVTGSFYPVIDSKGKRYRLFTVYSDGRMEIWFAYIKQIPPFDQEQNLSELLFRLNQIAGVSLAKESVNRYPGIKLSVFAEGQALKQFFAIFDWVFQEINV